MIKLDADKYLETTVTDSKDRVKVVIWGTLILQDISKKKYEWYNSKQYKFFYWTKCQKKASVYETGDRSEGTMKQPLKGM